MLMHYKLFSYHDAGTLFIREKSNQNVGQLPVVQLAERSLLNPEIYKFKPNH